MASVKLYIVRHGKTMFNTIGRAQGWSDTPLTAEVSEVFTNWELVCVSQA